MLQVRLTNTIALDMAEFSQHRTDERQALLDKNEEPSMAKYNSRVGRARVANQNARNQAQASGPGPVPTTTQLRLSRNPAA